MAGKFNNKSLIILLVALAGIFIITKIYRSKKTERTLKSDLVQIDTSKINTILIYPRSENGEEIRFTKKADGWTVQKGEIIAEAEPNSVDNLFNELLVMKPERLAARAKEKWGDYHVDDSLGTRVIMKEGNRVRVDLVIGRFNYQQGPGGYTGYGRNYGRGITYARLTDENEVYAVEGFMAMTFNQQFNNWRNQAILAVTKNDITVIKADYPADSGFTAIRHDSLWLVDGLQPDSAKMAQYINALSRKSNSSFADDFTPVIAPYYQLTIEGNNMSPVIVKAYRRGENEFILNSSLNPESYFISDSAGIFKSIFQSRAGLLPDIAL